MSVPDEMVARYHNLLGTYRNRTSAALLSIWDRLEGYNEADVETFITQTAPIWTGAKAASVAASAGFFAVALGIPPVAVKPDDVDFNPNPRGPFTAVWHAYKMGRPYEEAVAAGRSAVSAAGYDFVQRVARRTGDVVAERSGA